MRAYVYYKHEEENSIAFSPYRKADGDEMFVQFQPENGETLPFPNGESMIPFADFVQWFAEREQAIADTEELLNIIAETVEAEYQNDLEVIENV